MTYSYKTLVESHITRRVTNRQIANQAWREKAARLEKSPLSSPLTISGAYGSQAKRIAEKVTQKFSYHLFDREIIIDICNDTKVQTAIIEALDQFDNRDIASLMDQMFSKRVITPDSYRHILTRIIRSLSLFGPACFIGRGGCHILREMDAFNIRIVASLEDRIQRVAKRERVDLKTAQKTVLMQDENRRNFIKTHFNRDINDPTAYHIVLNTSLISIPDSIDMICTHVDRRIIIN